MSDSLSIKATLVGDADVKQHFLDFGDELRERLRRELTRLGSDLREAAAAGAPRKSGDLASSIRARLNETNTRMTETVGPSGREAFIGHLMEFGVVDHGTAHNKAGAGGKREKVRRVRELRAAGNYRIAPHPFMGPAMESMRSRIDEDLARVVDEAVAKANT